MNPTATTINAMPINGRLSDLRSLGRHDLRRQLALRRAGPHYGIGMESSQEFSLKMWMGRQLRFNCSLSAERCPAYFRVLGRKCAHVLGRFPYAGQGPDARPVMAGIRKPSPSRPYMPPHSPPESRHDAVRVRWFRWVDCEVAYAVVPAIRLTGIIPRVRRLRNAFAFLTPECERITLSFRLD
jgi:hypothetical protein